MSFWSFNATTIYIVIRHGGASNNAFGIFLIRVWHVNIVIGLELVLFRPDWFILVVEHLERGLGFPHWDDQAWHVPLSGFDFPPKWNRYYMRSSGIYSLAWSLLRLLMELAWVSWRAGLYIMKFSTNFSSMVGKYSLILNYNRFHFNTKVFYYC